MGSTRDDSRSGSWTGKTGRAGARARFRSGGASGRVTAVVSVDTTVVLGRGGLRSGALVTRDIGRGAGSRRGSGASALVAANINTSWVRGGGDDGRDGRAGLVVGDKVGRGRELGRGDGEELAGWLAVQETKEEGEAGRGRVAGCEAGRGCGDAGRG